VEKRRSGERERERKNRVKKPQNSRIGTEAA
jgi:hypothetical protein